MSLKNPFKLSIKDKAVEESDIQGSLAKQIGRVMGMFFAKRLVKTKITPNQVTLICFLFGLLAAFMFYLAEYKYILIGAVFLLMHFISDYIDGSLARMRGTSGNLGHWYDHISDAFAKTILFFFISLGVYNQTHNYLALVAGFFAAVSYLIQDVIFDVFKRLFPFADKVIEKEKSKRKFLKQFYYNMPVVIAVMLIAALLNQMFLYIVFSAIYGTLFTLGMFFALTLKIKKNF